MAGLWPTKSRRITSGFGVQRPGHKHAGIDIAGAMGDPIYAPRPGVVKFTGPQQGYGNTVVIDHGDGTETLLAHAERLLSKIGQRVNTGDTVALVGSTGRSTGPHLHYEERKGGVAVSPNGEGTLSSLASPLQNLQLPNFMGMLNQSIQQPLPLIDPSNPMRMLESISPVNVIPDISNPFASVAPPKLPDIGLSQSPLTALQNILPSVSTQPIQNSSLNVSGTGQIAEKIRSVAGRYGVPFELALAVARAESGLRANAKSGAGAVGVFQLMPATAKGLGVDPYDIDQNIEGGIKYLSGLLKRHGGDYVKALASYNAGPGAVASGKWRRYPETVNYVRKIMGMLNG